MYQDTIAAISTPLGEGGIGIVRLSGQHARPIVERLFDRPLADRRLVWGHIVDPDSRQLVDEVLVAYMPGPHTYTREDVVEINCHSGYQSLHDILGLVVAAGARTAAPGEFTLRAFLNGRIDLSQAESVLDVIEAKTQASLRLAVDGLTGRLSGRIGPIRNELLSVLAYLTARIDFPEDEVAPEDALGPITRAGLELEHLIAGADAGIVLRQGVRTAIVGRPNVGKSSLLNLLLRQSRAIVTPLPGTTRDTLEEVANLGGVPFILIDTAGIAESGDVIEALGVERSRRAIREAELVLLVVDMSVPLDAQDWDIAKLVDGDTAVLVVANKSDLPTRADLGGMHWPAVAVSALTGAGLEALEGAMVGSVLGGKTVGSDALLVANVRQKGALERAARHLSGARASLELNMPDDFVTIDLTAALSALGEITGETVGDDLLKTIFSRFCVGK